MAYPEESAWDEDPSWQGDYDDSIEGVAWGTDLELQQGWPGDWPDDEEEFAFGTVTTDELHGVLAFTSSQRNVSAYQKASLAITSGDVNEPAPPEGHVSLWGGAEHEEVAEAAVEFASSARTFLEARELLNSVRVARGYFPVVGVAAIPTNLSGPVPTAGKSRSKGNEANGRK